jgi:hypothetical protein
VWEADRVTVSINGKQILDPEGYPREFPDALAAKAFYIEADRE